MTSEQHIRLLLSYRKTESHRFFRTLEGQNITPSVVLFPDAASGSDEPLVGDMAKHSAATAPLDVVQFVKRQMGDPNWRFESANGHSYTAEEVSAVILKKLKNDAEIALGQPNY